jgi:hypothetical protein
MEEEYENGYYEENELTEESSTGLHFGKKWSIQLFQLFHLEIHSLENWKLKNQK